MSQCGRGWLAVLNLEQASRAPEAEVRPGSAYDASAGGGVASVIFPSVSGRKDSDVV